MLNSDKIANNADRVYLELLDELYHKGKVRDTRSGAAASVFGRQIRFNLSEGFPLLTTKKVSYKNIFHELVWFLSGNTNIKYLVENKVNIWNDDAYRYYGELCQKCGEYKMERDSFITAVLKGQKKTFKTKDDNSTLSYTFGDLGDIYGKQWRNFGVSGTDQIKEIIEKLKRSPKDRRMLCIAYNPDAINSKFGVALPPCHVMFQFYAEKLTREEREEIFKREHPEDAEYYSDMKRIPEYAIEAPRYRLSCMWTQRSVDICCGLPYNIASYALLTSIMAEICGMVPGELIGSLGDTHLYLNHMEGAKEQLGRTGNALPTLRFTRKLKGVDDITMKDIYLDGYKPEEAIEFKLNVG